MSISEKTKPLDLEIDKITTNIAQSTYISSKPKKITSLNCIVNLRKYEHTYQIEKNHI